MARIIFLFMLCFVLLGCVSPRPTDSKSLTNSGPLPGTGITLAVAFESNEFEAGAAVDAHVTVSNLTQDVIILMETEPNMDISFEVYDEDGAAVAETSYGRLLEYSRSNRMIRGPIQKAYSPGASRTFTFRVSLQHDMTVSGRYRIRAKY